MPHGIPPHQRLHRPQGRLRDHHHGPPSPLRPYQRTRRDPPPQRVLPGPQIGSPEHRPPVEQQRRRIATLGDRLGPRRTHHQRGRPRHRIEHLLTPGRPHRHSRKRPPQLLRGPPRPDDLGPQPEPPHSGQCQEFSSTPHHPHRSTPASCPSNGPAQCRHRAAARHWAQAIRGTYPRRGTCTSTGPCLSPSRTACHANVGNRAARAASSRAKSPSPTVRTSGAAPSPGRATRPTAAPTHSPRAARPPRCSSNSPAESRTCPARPAAAIPPAHAAAARAARCDSRPRRPRSRRAPDPEPARTSRPGSRRPRARTPAARPATAGTASRARRRR